MHTSKAFHATLPWLDDAELSRLRAWACQNCAASSLAREDDVVIWRATKERARTREAFLRSVRSTLKRLAVDVSRLKGRWLVLADEGSVALPLPPPDAPKLSLDAGEPTESDVEVIALGNSSGRARAPSRLQVVKD
jgi:hypothetical protein